MAFFTAAAGFFSMIDTAAKVVTSTVDVVSGNKTFTEAAAEVVESVKSNPIVKIAANTAQVIAGEKTFEEASEDVLDSVKNTTAGRMVEAAVDIANGEDVGETLVEAAKDSKVGQSVAKVIDTVDDAVQGEAAIEDVAAQVVEEATGSHASGEVAKQVINIANDKTSPGDGLKQSAQAIGMEIDANATKEALLINDQISKDPGLVKKAMDGVINKNTQGTWSVAKKLVDSTGLSNIDERQNAAIQSFSEGDLGNGLKHSAGSVPLVNNLVSAIEIVSGSEGEATNRHDSITPPSGEAMTGLVDYVYNHKKMTNKYYSKIRDLSDSTGLTDMKSQMIQGWDALFQGEFEKATQHFIRTNVLINAVAREKELGDNYQVTAPGAKQVIALMKHEGMKGADWEFKFGSQFGSGKVMQQQAEDLYDDLINGRFEQALSKAPKLLNQAHQDGVIENGDQLAESLVRLQQLRDRFADFSGISDRQVDDPLTDYQKGNSTVSRHAVDGIINVQSDNPRTHDLIEQSDLVSEPLRTFAGDTGHLPLHGSVAERGLGDGGEQPAAWVGMTDCPLLDPLA